MSLPVKPLPADVVALKTARRLDATAAGLVLLGWPMLMMIPFSLGAPGFFMAAMAAAGLGVFFLCATGVLNLRKAQRRIVSRRLTAETAKADQLAVECTVNAFLTNRDLGVLWREGDVLRFQGTESEFSIPSDAVAMALPAPNDHQTVHIPLRMGASLVQISLRGIEGNRDQILAMVEPWASARLYGGEEASAWVVLRTRRPNPLNTLLLIVPCAPLAVYVTAMSYDQPSLIFPCFLILTFGLWRLLNERQRLFEEL